MNGSEYRGYPYYAAVLPFERNHDFEKMFAWIEKNWIVSVYITVIYLAAVFTFERYMRDKPPVNVRKFFLWWNAALAIFSFGGMCRGLPEVTHVLWNYGLEFSVCNSKLNAVSGFWVTAFLFSKIVELFETSFLILRKKLSSIHLIHHVLTLLLCWVFASDRPGLGRWLGALNFTVHAFMYAYFALKASNVHLPETVSFAITTLQILQFVIGLIVSVFTLYVISIGHHCSTPLRVAIGAIFISGYFFFIFGKYYIQRYFKPKPKSKIM